MSQLSKNNETMNEIDMHNISGLTQRINQPK